MRRTLTALVLFSATLFILQYLPQKAAIVVRRTSTDDQMAAQWVQTTVGDFEAGELDCLELEATGDGELVLAQDQEGLLCPRGVFTSESQETSVLFNVVGSAWDVERPMGTTFQLELRVSSDGAQWDDWIVVSADEDGPGSEPHQHGNLVEVKPSRYVQYRLTLGTFEPSVSPLVREVVLTVMNTREGPTVDEARAMLIPQEVTSGVPQPRIVSRQGWGANEAWASREPVYRKPTHFVIHHTASGPSTSIMPCHEGGAISATTSSSIAKVTSTKGAKVAMPSLGFTPGTTTTAASASPFWVTTEPWR